MTPPLKVCIDARLRDGEYGGVQQVVLGMAHGLGGLTDGDERYLFLALEGDDAWLRPHLGPNSEILNAGPAAARPAGWRAELRGSKAWEPVRKALTPLLDLRPVPPVAHSDGRVEASGAEVMHFTIQSAFVTRLPSIYHPHDLQHVHLPQFFSGRDRRVRDAHYREFCARAEMVAVTSSWVKQDLIRHFGLDAGKVRVIEWAPPNLAYPETKQEEMDRIRDRFGLPRSFIFYPAQTWPHKNHLGLLNAIARLRHEHELIVPLVCSGSQNDFFPRIWSEVERLGLVGQVHFVSFVQPDELQALYQMAVAVVIPTRFEAASYPVWEAFIAGVPVAAASVTSLPAQVGDAGLLFDPDSPEDMAYAIRRLWLDHELSAELVQRGSERVRQFTWERTARIFRAHYRRLAGRPLTEDDRVLVDAPPLL